MCIQPKRILIYSVVVGIASGQPLSHKLRREGDFAGTADGRKQFYDSADTAKAENVPRSIWDAENVRTFRREHGTRRQSCRREQRAHRAERQQRPVW